jgi:hypothetical protein
MFDPIEAPDVHRGPATGHSTEFGTTWQEAVSRINAGFKALFERGAAAVDSSIGVHPDFVKALEARFEHAEDALSDAMFKIDALEAKIKAYETPPPAQSPDTPPPEDAPAVVTGSTPA